MSSEDLYPMFVNLFAADLRVASRTRDRLPWRLEAPQDRSRLAGSEIEDKIKWMLNLLKFRQSIHTRVQLTSFSESDRISRTGAPELSRSSNRQPYIQSPSVSTSFSTQQRTPMSTNSLPTEILPLGSSSERDSRRSAKFDPLATSQRGLF
jgi:hypothetical protein